MIQAIIHSIVAAHRPILLISLALGLVSIGLLAGPGLHQDYTVESLIAADDAEYHEFRAFSKDFVSGEMAVFAVDAGDPLAPNNVELLHWICEQCRQVEGVELPMAISELPEIGLWALFRPGEELETVYERLQRDPGARDEIEAELRDNPLVVGSLVGKDPNTGGLNTTAGVLVQVKGEGDSRRRKVVADELRDILADAKERRPDAKLLLGGPIVGLIEIFEAIQRDMAVFTVVVFVLICVALWLIFRRSVPLLVALTAAGLSTLCVLGVSVVARLPMSLVSQTVVILVIVLGVSMCVHLLIAHEETRLRRTGPARGPMHDARETLNRMFIPCATVAATSTLGLASLFISTLRPVRQLAALVIIGIVWALVLGLAAIPGWARLAARTPPKDHEDSPLTRALSRLGRLAHRENPWPMRIILLFGIFICLCLIKVPAALDNFEADFVKNFRRDSNVRRVYRFVKNNLGPVGNIEVVVRRVDGEPVIGEVAWQAIQSSRSADWWRLSDPAERAAAEKRLIVEIGRQLRAQARSHTSEGLALIRAVDAFQDVVAAEFNPPVKKTISIVDLVRLASFGRLLGWTMLEMPTFEWQFALTMVLIDQKLNDQFMRNFLTADGKAMRINLRALESDDVYRKLEVARKVEKRAQQILGPRFAVQVTGLYPLYASIAYDLLKDQLRTFALALVLVATCMCVGLRSAKLGLLSMIPNLMPMIFCLGVMGWAEIPINMATAMMLSVALGIAVDNTIHYCWRFKYELAIDQDYDGAIIRTHRTVGRACVFNSIVIVGGFWVLMLSEFVPTVYFGMMIGLTMVGALAGDLVLLPMLLTLLRPVPVKRFEV